MFPSDSNLQKYRPDLLPTAATQRTATITLQRALATGTSPDVLRAVAKWNERKSFDERRRKARARLKDQAAALVIVADGLEYERIDRAPERCA